MTSAGTSAPLESYPTSASMLPQGRTVLSAALWAPGPAHTAVPAHHVQTVLALPPPNATLWTGAEDGMLIRWGNDEEAEDSGGLKATVLMHGAGVGVSTLLACTSVACKPSVLSISVDGQLTVWDARTGRCIVTRRCVHLSGGIRCAAALGSNPRYAVAESCVLCVLVLIDCKTLHFSHLALAPASAPADTVVVRPQPPHETCKGGEVAALVLAGRDGQVFKVPAVVPASLTPTVTAATTSTDARPAPLSPTISAPSSTANASSAPLSPTVSPPTGLSTPPKASAAAAGEFSVSTSNPTFVSAVNNASTSGVVPNTPPRTPPQPSLTRSASSSPSPGPRPSGGATSPALSPSPPSPAPPAHAELKPLTVRASAWGSLGWDDIPAPSPANFQSSDADDKQANPEEPGREGARVAVLVVKSASGRKVAVLTIQPWCWEVFTGKPPSAKLTVPLALPQAKHASCGANEDKHSDADDDRAPVPPEAAHFFQTGWAGGVFLEDPAPQKLSTNGQVQSTKGYPLQVLVWSSSGGAALYRVALGGSSEDSAFALAAWLCAPLHQIGHDSGQQVTCHFSYCPDTGRLYRVASSQTKAGAPEVCPVQVCVWSIKHRDVRGGGPPGSTQQACSSPATSPGNTLIRAPCSTSSLADAWGCIDQRPAAQHSQPRATASAVLFLDQYFPQMLVRGYVSGRVEMFRLPCTGGSATVHFQAHAGAVLSVQEAVTGTGARASSAIFQKVVYLITSGEDATVRVWDPATCAPLATWRHHTGPVPQLVLPPTPMEGSWADIILSVGDDGMVGLISLETMRVERLLPGHPARIDEFAWDVRNGYLGCLCQNGCLLVWDLLSGALERMLHGAAARLLFHQLERNTPRPGGVARRAVRVHCPSPALAVLSVDVPLLLSPKGDSLQEATRSSHRNHKPSPAPPAYSVPAPYSGAGKVTPEEARALWLVLECFHPWGLDPAMDRLVYWMGEQGGEASLQGAGPIATQGLLGGVGYGPGGVLTPLAASQHMMWRLCPDHLSHHALALTAVAHRLAQGSQGECASANALLTFYAVDAAEMLSGAPPPTLALYVGYWQDTCCALRDAARLLFRSAATWRLPLHLTSMPAWHAHVASQSGHASLGGPGALSLLVAAAACVECLATEEQGGKVQVARELPGYVAPRLVQLLKTAPNAGSAPAGALLADGMSLWIAHLGSEAEVRLLLETLLGLSERLTHQPGSAEHGVAGATPIHVMLAREAVGAVVHALACTSPSCFLRTLHHRLPTAPATSPSHLTAIMALIMVVQTRPAALVSHLRMLVDVVMTALDPSRPILRRTCLQVATALVRELVLKYPVVAFHAAAMRLCVGPASCGDHIGTTAGPDSSIAAVYDLQSATKIRILEEMEGIVMPPYEGLVTLNFSADGNFLAAFSVPVIATSEISPSSASQGTLRVWSLTASWRQTMFLQRIAITVPAHVHRAIVIDSRHVVAHHHQVTAGVSSSGIDLGFKLEWMSATSLRLSHEGKEIQTVNV